MIVPFGFSVGDFISVGALIITVATLIIKLTRELKSAALASSANATLITELECLHRTLVSVGQFVSSHKVPSERAQSGIKEQARLCSQTLSKFAVVSEKYSEIKEHGGLKNGARRVWMKLMVGMCAEEEKRRLREGIRTYLDIIHCYMAMDQA